jgi:D-alanyl-D-alanine-carboxypeptidase/D-alanyl-D-alanine-endopeptidase
VAAAPAESTIVKILGQRVDVEKRSVGMAAAVVTGRARRTVFYGAERVGSDRKVSDETLFEIGSITKVFTALLLANLARDGRVAIDDPAAKHLPSISLCPSATVARSRLQISPLTRQACRACRR